jgi:16S rRNA (cytosine967-C5)-methyltransferase
MKRVTENLVRLKLAHSVQAIVTDARTWEPAPDLNRAVNTFDIVVLDAPCSSTGTLRRHPEHPWIHDKNDIEKLGEVQRDLLCRAADHVSHDGILLYCTCSHEPEEGEDRIDSFLNQNKDFRQITQIPAAVHPYLKPGRGNIGFRTDMRILQDKGGLDGFFIALLKRL